MKKKLLFGAMILSTVAAFADVKTPQEQENTYGAPVKPVITSCESFREFQTAYEDFLKDPDLALSQEKSARLALQVSEGCNGAAARFRKSYEMMKKTGVALTKAVEIGLEFARIEDDRLSNFTDVFSKMYLENVFNFDFPTAYKVSFALSKDYDGKAKDVRDDFNKLVTFCTGTKKISLPVRQCAEFALVLVEHSSKFPGGLYSEFETFYEFLRTDKNLGLSVQEALKVIPKVFAYGPKASMNFRKGLEYSLASGKLAIDHKNAINLSLRLAEQTLPTTGVEQASQAAKAGSDAVVSTKK